MFNISYLPVEYGKIKLGKLIIETDEVQWLYEVKGDHLDYKPPDIKQSHLYDQTQSGHIRDVQSAKQYNRPVTSSTFKPNAYATTNNQNNTKSNFYQMTNNKTTLNNLKTQVRDKSLGKLRTTRKLI